MYDRTIAVLASLAYLLFVLLMEIMEEIHEESLCAVLTDDGYSFSSWHAP